MDTKKTIKKMRKIISFCGLVLTAAVLSISCEKDVTVLNPGSTPTPTPEPSKPTPEAVKVTPIDITNQGYEFMEKIQGHWVGQNRVISDDYPWFAFDFRAISENICSGIFEGGSMGNLFNQFFITDLNGTKTIMIRNGGVLNGIYRTSYFVMDSLSTQGGDFYRFVDAIGGEEIMSMEFKFVQGELFFNAYTSKLGLNSPATRHMTFKGKRRGANFVTEAATKFSYPQNTVSPWNFSSGIDTALTQGSNGKKSATFLASDQTGTKTVFDLAPESGDPYTIFNQPELAVLELNIDKNTDYKSLLFISEKPITDAAGYFNYNVNNTNSVILFSELIESEKNFTFTYVHPGTYFVNVTLDVNGDGVIGPGDITHAQKQVTLVSEDQKQITINNITIQN
jgi:hypothetical protein